MSRNIIMFALFVVAIYQLPTNPSIATYTGRMKPSQIKSTLYICYNGVTIAIGGLLKTDMLLGHQSLYHKFAAYLPALEWF